MYRVSWRKLLKDIKKLAKQINDSGIKYDAMVIIGRGGLYLGTFLSHYLGNLPLAVTMANRYMDKSGGVLSLSESVATLIEIKGNVLLVDEIIDEGVTVDATIEYLLANYRSIENFTVASLYKRPGIKYPRAKPFFYVKEIERKNWIRFFYEKE